jgi:hypothetical protein
VRTARASWRKIVLNAERHRARIKQLWRKGRRRCRRRNELRKGSPDPGKLGRILEERRIQCASRNRSACGGKLGLELKQAGFDFLSGSVNRPLPWSPTGKVIVATAIPSSFRHSSRRGRETAP